MPEDAEPLTEDHFWGEGAGADGEQPSSRDVRLVDPSSQPLVCVAVK